MPRNESSILYVPYFMGARPRLIHVPKRRDQDPHTEAGAPQENPEADRDEIKVVMAHDLLCPRCTIL